MLAVLLAACAMAFRPAPVFTLDLAKPPKQRWTGAVATVLANVTWEESFEGFFNRAEVSVYKHMTSAQKQTVVSKVQSAFPENYEEIQGLVEDFANNGHPEVSLEYLTLWVFWHELYHAKEIMPPLESQVAMSCTGVLALPEDTSLPIFHGRNLDQEGWHGRNITLQVEVINSTESATNVLYQAVDVYWFASGFVTVSAIDRVTMQENWRSPDRNPPQTMAEIVHRIGNDPVVPQVLMYRIILERITANTTGPQAFHDAKNFLLTSTFAAPFYAIMSGAGRQGAVLSIAWNSSLNVVATISDAGSDDGKWYMVQTNHDRWQPDPPSDPRRTRAEEAFESLGRGDGATRTGVWMVISEYPVHNRHTFYSLLMDVTRPTRGFIRLRMEPDPFFGRSYHYVA